MKLFSPKEVKDNIVSTKVRENLLLDKLLAKKHETLDETKRRIDPERERLEKEFVDFNLQIQEKKSLLSQEVLVLEQRRSIALKPLDDLELKLETKSIKLEELETELRTQLAKVSVERSQLAENLITLKDKSAELADREIQLIRQENGAKEEALQLKLSADDLNLKWLEFHKVSKEKELELSEQLTKNTSDAKANDVLRKELENETLKIADDRRAIKDGYDSLAKARQEILGRTE